MGIRGSLKTMPLDQLLDWVHQHKKTGIIQLQRGSLAKDLFIENGIIVSSGTNDPREYLGQFFISFGKLTEEDLVKTYQIQKETRVYFGKILVMIEKATENQVQRVLLHKTRETILDCFLWDEGNFAFNDQKEALSGLQIPVSIEIPKMIEEGKERTVEWKSISKIIPSTHVALFTCPNKFPKGFPQKTDDKKLIHFIDTRKKIPEICYEFHMSEFLVTKKIYQLIQKGIIRVDQGLEETRKKEKLEEHKMVEKFKGGIRIYKKGQLKEAYEIFAEILHEFPTNKEASKYYHKIRKEIIDQLSNQLEENKTPQLHVPLESVKMAQFDAQEAYVLSRVNGQWTVGEIVQICPFAQEKVLGALEKFLDQKIIEI
jgi:hypothetical protein